MRGQTWKGETALIQLPQSLPSFNLSVSMGSIIIVASIVSATTVILHALTKVTKPLMLGYRQHNVLVRDFHIRTECADVQIFKETEMRDPDEFYRRHPERLPRSPVIP
jgi:hypothetical protein